MKTFASFYNFYSLPVIRICRIIAIILPLTMFLLGLKDETFLTFPFFFFSLFLMFEIFYTYHVVRTLPSQLIAQNTGDVTQSATLQILSLTMVYDQTQLLVQLLALPQIRFMLEKAEIKESELSLTAVPMQDIWGKAASIAKNLQGKYITTVDFFAAYMLITEPQTKVLFIKEIKAEEFMHIVYWTKLRFAYEELPKKTRVHFLGEGIGEGMVSGWTRETKNYINDITYDALKEGQIFLGRKKEYGLVIEALLKDTKNNVIIVGDPGIGKTALVHTLAYQSFAGDLQGRLYHKRFYELFIGALLAGANDTGELSRRLQAIIEEISHAGNILVFIPEIENIFGSSSFHLNLSGALLPYLRDHKIQIIATTTSGAYKSYIEPMESFSEVFETVRLEEPDHDSAIQMLLEKADAMEQKHDIVISYKALVACVELAKRYMQDKSLPGSAVSLLDLVASAVSLAKKPIVQEQDVVTKIEEKTHVAVAAPQKEEKDLLLHFEDKMHERVVDQEQAIHGIAEAIRRVRAGLSPQQRPISFLFLGPTGVGKTETAKALAALYFGGEDKMIRLDMSEYTTPEAMSRLLGAAPGQGEEKGELTEKIYEDPFTIVLLDEFEKAHPDILNLFLQVLEDGRLTDNKGKTVSFANAIVIATSNAGAEFIREEILKGTAVDKNFQQNLLNLLQTKGIFRPELLNRFDEIVAFKPLGDAEVLAITKMMLTSLSKKLLEQDITANFDDKVILAIAKNGFDIQFGARPLRRYVQNNISDQIAQKILQSEIQRGSKISISVDTNGIIQITQ